MGNDGHWTTRGHAVFDLVWIARETFVEQIDYHPSIESTNARAAALAAQDARPLPLLVLTERQTAGRGRGTNTWWSVEGALTFSLLLDLPRGPGQTELWPRAALAAAVAVCEALGAQARDVSFGIRWPNDVCVGGRKICGILPELQLGRSPRLVLGVGVNVNNPARQAPDGLSGQIISLCDISGAPCPLTDLLVDLLRRLEVRLKQLHTADPQLSDAWRARCLLRGKAVRLRMGDDEIAGACLGIDDTGALLVQTASGVERFYGGTLAAVGDLAAPFGG